MNEKNARSNAKKTRVRIVNKKSGIVIAAFLGLFVVALAALSTGPIMRPFSSQTLDSFEMDEIQLGNAHNSAQLVMHNHATLEVYMQGTKIAVPASIGIDSTLHRDRSLDSFGIQDPAMAPMHTHANDGVIHIESTEFRDYTLGEFLDIWGMNFEGQKVLLKAQGTETEDFRNYVLRDGDRLILETR